MGGVGDDNLLRPSSTARVVGVLCYHRKFPPRFCGSPLVLHRVPTLTPPMALHLPLTSSRSSLFIIDLPLSGAPRHLAIARADKASPWSTIKGGGRCHIVLPLLAGPVNVTGIGHLLITFTISHPRDAEAHDCCLHHSFYLVCRAVGIPDREIINSCPMCGQKT